MSELVLIRQWRLSAQGTWGYDVIVSSWAVLWMKTTSVRRPNYEDVAAVADQIGIHLLLCQFWKSTGTVLVFLANYRAGRTPNRMLCVTRKSVQAFLVLYDPLGADYLGDWALCSVVRDEDSTVHSLWRTWQDQTLFPQSNFRKNNSKTNVPHWDIWKSLKYGN